MKHLFLTALFFVLFHSNSFAQTWLKVSAGAEFSLALRSDGTLWSWGDNTFGELGIGSINPQFVPVQIGSENDWADVAAGAIHALAIKKDGSLWAWGYNTEGELGDGTVNQENSPVRIGTDNDWARISATMQTSFAIKKNNTLWGWGLNDFGAIGDGTTISKSSPVMISAETDWISIRGGGYHVLAMKSDHSIWSWGFDGNGQMGRGVTHTIDSLPHQIGSDKNWMDISSGFEFSLGLKSDGSLWSWGFNGNGQLGIGTTAEDSLPHRIGSENDWKSIAAGASFAFAQKNDGSLWGWGFNEGGNLGDGDTAQQISPVHIGTDKDWLMISAAKGLAYNGSVYGLHTLTLHNDAKEICTAGTNNTGQLGNGSQNNASTFDCSVGAISSVAQSVMADVLITISPNPATDNVTISVSGLMDSHLEIYDLRGIQIYASILHDNLQWNVKDVSIESGAYVIRVSGKDGKGNHITQSQQLIVKK